MWEIEFLSSNTFTLLPMKLTNKRSAICASSWTSWTTSDTRDLFHSRILQSNLISNCSLGEAILPSPWSRLETILPPLQSLRHRKIELRHRHGQFPLLRCLLHRPLLNFQWFGSEIVPPTNDIKVGGDDRGPRPIPRRENGNNKRIGILNFMDRLLTLSCTKEKVMVFTMKTKEHVDPNLLRPGRVDVHIHFPLCDFSALKTLESSYLGVKEHKL